MPPASATLPEIADQPHASAVLGAALADGGEASHAYLFHGPSGSGKRAVARAFAAALLREGARNPDTVRERVERHAHPDLTWVTPSGAAEMLVADIEEPVVAAATRTPFESARRVFVLECVDKLNDQAANRLLKTLEEPPDFVHLLLLTDRRADVMPTIASRCQQIRFDAAPTEQIARRLSDAGVEEPRARACARLALGDAGLARELAAEPGRALRAAAEDYIRAAFAGDAASRPWLALLESSRAAGERESERALARVEEELELIPARERKRYEREAAEARRRGERRERTATLDRALGLAELWVRDVLCLREGAGELIFTCDRAEALSADAEGRSEAGLRGALELIAAARISLRQHVAEDLALEALAYRLQAALAAGVRGR